MRRKFVLRLFCPFVLKSKIRRRQTKERKIQDLGTFAKN